MLLGAGSAFVSGADRALLWTSLGEGSRQSEYTRWEGRLRAASQTIVALVRLAFIVAGPPIGVLVDRAGLETALAVLALVFTALGVAALALFAHAHRIERAGS
jgi:MFS family permease